MQGPRLVLIFKIIAKAFICAGFNIVQVKILNKLASARASGKGGGSKVLTDLIEGLQEPAFSIELRLKINQFHPDLKEG